MKTLFKLSAVALALVASGAIAQVSIMPVPPAPRPTRPVVDLTNWSIGQAMADKTISAAVTSQYGNNSDIAWAHRRGWKGQNMTIWTSTVNRGAETQAVGHEVTSASAAFANSARTIVPGATVIDGGNYKTGPELGDAPRDVAISLTSVQNLGNSESHYIRGATGVAVLSRASDSFVIFSAQITDSTNQNGGTTRPLTISTQEGYKHFIATSVDTGNAAANANLTMSGKTAYLAGSAAIIQSKFVNLNPEAVVTHMQTGVSGTGVFRLGTTLAARALR